MSLQFDHCDRSHRKELTLCSDLHRSIVTVYVGPEKYPFYLHKGRLCQKSSFFEKAFHGSFEEASTGSIYLEEDDVAVFELLEEWLYSEKVNYSKDCDDPSLLMVKVFCFAERVRIPTLQNITLDAIRDRATGRKVVGSNPHTTSEITKKPQALFGYPNQPQWGFLEPQEAMTGSDNEEVIAEYLNPASTDAVIYAYENTLELSPLRKLLADIFAYNVKSDTLGEDILMFPAEFLADVVLCNMKRLPLRLHGEKADFDENADKYHIDESSSICDERGQRTFEGANEDEIKCDFGLPDAPPADPVPEAGPELEPPADSGIEDSRITLEPPKKLKKSKKSEESVKTKKKSKIGRAGPSIEEN